MPDPETTTKIRRPAPGSKAEAILTLTTTTPATVTEIAESVRCAKSTVSETLKRYQIQPNTLESYKNHRADVLAGIGDKLLQKANIDTLKIESMRDLKDAITGYGILYDKERIERGLSDSASKPLVMIQINAPGGTDVKAVTVDNPVDKSRYQPISIDRDE